VSLLGAPSSRVGVRGGARMDFFVMENILIPGHNKVGLLFIGGHLV